MKCIHKNRFWIMITLLVSFSCNPSFKNKSNNTSLIDIAKWNQETINLMIKNFRIDTTCFLHQTPTPPLSEDPLFSYPIDSKAFDNDIATVWSFINQRNYLAGILDSIIQSKGFSQNLLLVEFYQAFKPTQFEINDGNSFIEIVIGLNGALEIRDIDEISEMAPGYIDYRRNNSPIRTIRSKFNLNFEDLGNVRFILESLYIDSSYAWDK